jgi:hypothetical protein
MQRSFFKKSEIGSSIKMAHRSFMRIEDGFTLCFIGRRGLRAFEDDVPFNCIAFT